MYYRVLLEKDSNDTFLVTFPDLPWIHTFGDTEDEALTRAQDALVTGLEFLIKTKQPIPMGTRGPSGDRIVAVPALLCAKIKLHNELLAQGINRAELGRRLKVHRPQVDRLVDAHHASRLDQLEAAFHVLGKRLEVQVVDLPAETAHSGVVASGSRVHRSDSSKAMKSGWRSRGRGRSSLSRRAARHA